jgi:hypothetical protein
MVILEALACGTPVLTTPETAAAAGAEASLLMTADRTSEATESATAHLLATVTPEQRCALAEQVARRWRWETIVGTYLSVLSDLPEPVRRLSNT